MKVASQLQEEGVINNPFVFRLMYQIRFSPAPIKAGEYKISLPTSIQEVLQLVVKGQVYRSPISGQRASLPSLSHGAGGTYSSGNS